MKNYKNIIKSVLFVLIITISLTAINPVIPHFFNNISKAPIVYSPRESFAHYEETTGMAYDVYVSGDYVYVADGNSGLAVIDISDPTNPEMPVYEDTFGFAHGVYVSGDYAYVADYGSGLAVIDISDPTNPGIPIYEDTTGDAISVYVSGDYAYVADGYTGLAVIDISDPENPGIPIYEDTFGFAHGVYVSGDYAYVAGFDSGLVVIDISDPTNPGIPVYEDTTGNAMGVYVSGDYAYVADGDSGLVVINISDPTNPERLIYEDTIGDACGVYVSGDYAYVADYNSGLAVIDISDPTNPGAPIYGDTTGTANKVCVSGNYAFLADGNSGLAVIQISEPIDPVTLIHRNAIGYHISVYVSGDYAYMANQYDTGMTVIDISDPANPGTPIYERTNDWPKDVYVSGDYAYLASWSVGLAIIDISNPTDPGAPIYEDTTGSAWGVYVSGDYAYVADYDSGLAIIDISNPTDPGTPIYEDTAGIARGVYVSGDFAYVANSGAGLAIIDISDPVNPGAPIYEDTTGNAENVYVSGNYAYVADGDSGLAIIDISDPTNPGTPVYMDTSGRAYDVWVDGNYVFLADGNSGLAVIDISDPTNPGAPIYEDTPGRALGVYVSGDYAYTAVSAYDARFSGLTVIQVRKRLDIADPTIISAPNDFSVEVDYTGLTLSWTATDHNPDIYIIELQGTGIVSGPSTWLNGISIVYNIPDGLSEGEYIYTITFRDDYGHFTTDSVVLTVQEPSITIITPEEKFYEGPMSGYYPATYGFENDKVGSNPFGFLVDDSGGPITVINTLDNHSNVLKLDDNTGALDYSCTVNQNFNSQNEGTIEFYVRLDSLDGLGRSIMLRNLSLVRAIHLKISFNEIQYRDSLDTWHTVYSNFQIDTWYHIRIDFNCSSDTFDIFIDNNQQGSNLEFNNELSSIGNIQFGTGQLATAEMYIDAIGYSWDPKYNVGDNLNEGLLLSFHKNYSFDWLGYSIDELPSKAILGNVSIPLPEDGPHSIQVYGNDSHGTIFQSDLRYFTIETKIPEIEIYSPYQYQMFGTISPKFNISIIEANLDSSWYTLDDGMTNISIVNLIGFIDLGAWLPMPNGPITIKFYAKDIVGNVGFNNVTVIKSIKNYLYVEITESLFSENEFNLTFYITNATGYGIDPAMIQMWWDGTDVSTDIQNLENGLYFVSLEPITIPPGEDPILLNMTISASGYEDKYFETDIGVDPEVIFKGNTPAGSDVEIIDEITGVNVTFSEVTDGGTTIIEKSEEGPEPPSGFEVAGDYYDIATDASYSGVISVAIPYDANNVKGHEKHIKILHLDPSTGWTDITTWVDTVNNIVYGEFTSLSTFVVLEKVEHEYIMWEIDQLIQAINNPDVCWRKSNNKNTMENKLIELKELISSNELAEAYDKLLHDIKPKLTGLKTDEKENPWGDGVFKNPWVTCLDFQDEFCSDCNTILNHLSVLHAELVLGSLNIYESIQPIYLSFSLIGLLGIAFAQYFRSKQKLKPSRTNLFEN